MLKPRLRPHAHLHRQEQRGLLWYVLQDSASGRHFRFTPEAYQFLGLLDGQRSVEEAWQRSRRVLEEDAPGQDEIIRLLSQLHASDLLDGYQIPDPEEVFSRGTKTRQRKRLQQYLSPLAVRIPLLDPERFLQSTRPLARFFFSAQGALIWALVLLGGGWVLVTEFDALTDNLTDRVLAADNILIILIAFPLLKLIHEFGHAFAVSRWGGEVHEMGVMFLVFMPIPYVDASASAVFRSHWQRAWVAAAGMYVEMFMAALAVIGWSLMEPGLLRSILFNIALIGSVTTLLFNINPLLRFDGYYILADAIDIPNLGTRANRYFLYLCQRYLLGLEGTISPAIARGEAGWFFFFSIASFCYRVVVVSLIALFVAGKFFFIGVMLALLAVCMMVVLPLAKLIWFLLANPRVHRGGVRAYSGAVMALLVVLAGVFMLPLPLNTYADGVIWVSEDAEITVGESGFVDLIPHVSGGRVEAGELLLQLSNRQLEMELGAINARRKALLARHAADRVVDRARAQLTAIELNHNQARIDELKARLSALTLNVQVPGALLVGNTADMPGSFVRKGEVLGFVVSDTSVRIRTLVEQVDAGLVRDRLQGVRVLMADNLNQEYEARLTRQVPAASDRLPSPVLSTQGGGQVVLKPDTSNGEPRAMNTLFHIELTFSQLPGHPRVGQRVHVKFLLGYEPAGYQVLRRARQLFLSRFQL